MAKKKVIKISIPVTLSAKDDENFNEAIEATKDFLRSKLQNQKINVGNCDIEFFIE